MNRFLVVNSSIVLFLFFFQQCSTDTEFNFDTIIILNYSEVPPKRNIVEKYVVEKSDKSEQITLVKYYPFYSESGTLKDSSIFTKIRKLKKQDNELFPNVFYHNKGKKVRGVHIDTKEIKNIISKDDFDKIKKRENILLLHDESYRDDQMAYLIHKANSMSEKFVPKKFKDLEDIKVFEATVFSDSLISTTVMLSETKDGNYLIRNDSLTSSEFRFD